MGNWQLEVGRMAMYMSFPVATFYYFNQPEYFENWVTSMRRELYPPENKMHREEIQSAIQSIQQKHDIQMMKAFEETDKKN